MPEGQAALLVMDVQEAIVSRFEAGDLLARLAKAIAAARSASVPVIYVKVEFRPGFPEVSPRNRAFAGLAQSGSLVGETTRIHPEVAPEAGEMEVVKKRVSAFSGSDLELVLRARQIDSLVLTGIATSGVVLSTLRAAADLDYELTVLRDCCLDADPEVHRVLCEKVFPRQADVLDLEEWERRLAEAALSSAPGPRPRA